MPFCLPTLLFRVAITILTLALLKISQDLQFSAQPAPHLSRFLLPRVLLDYLETLFMKCALVI